MMPNVFDQFDAPAPASNPFDQFDQPQEQDRPVTSEFLGPVKRFVQGVPRGVARGLTSIPKLLSGGVDPESVADIGPSRTDRASAAEEMAGGVDRRQRFEEKTERAMDKLGLPEPKGRAGKFGASVGEFLGDPLSYTGAGGVVRKAGTAALAGLGSEAARQVTDDNPVAGIVGGGVAAAAPRGLRRLATPFPADPKRLRNVNILRAEGVEPSAGDVSGRRAIKHFEELGDAPGGGGSYSRNRERIAKQFTNRVITAMGEPPTAEGQLDSTMLNRADRRIGRMFDDSRSQLEVVPDATAVKEARQFKVELKNERLPDEVTARVMARYNDMLYGFARDPATGRVSMSGSTYASLTSKKTPLSRATEASDPDVRYWSQRLKGILDDAAERTNAAAPPGSPQAGALKQLREARRQWFHYLVARGAMTRAGETAQTGYVTPQALRSLLVGDRKNAVRYALGRAELAPLARAGNIVLTQPRSSGTAERAMSQHPSLINIGRGLFGRAVNTPTMQKYLGNQAFPGRGGAAAPVTRATAAGIAQESDALAPEDQEDTLAPPGGL